jgi:uncharacterized protein with HEPN domain
MSDDRAHVLDALKAAERIGHFLEGVTEDRFLADIEKQSAVLHQFTILGEALRRVSESYQSSNSTIPWSRAIGFRNQIVHGYDEVDLDIVWRIAHHDLADLVNALTGIAQREPDAPTEEDGHAR